MYHMLSYTMAVYTMHASRTIISASTNRHPISTFIPLPGRLGENSLRKTIHRTKMQAIAGAWRFPMRKTRLLSGVLFLLGWSAGPLFAQQIGKFVPIQAGSEVDHALTEINAATDPAQKL